MKHKIAFFVALKVFVDKLTWLHPENFGDAINICLKKNRTGSLTAISAVQTVDFLKNLLMIFRKAQIQILGL